MPNIGNYGEDNREIDLHIGENIRLHRKMRGLTCNMLAQSVGVSTQQMQKYEKGTNRVSAGRLYQIAEKLGVDIKILFSGLGEADNSTDYQEFVSQRKTLALFSAYSKIENPKIRDQIVTLALQLAKLEDD